VVVVDEHHQGDVLTTPSDPVRDSFRLSRAVNSTIEAGNSVRRAGLILALAMPLFGASGSMPPAAAIGLLLATTVIYTLGDLWHSVGGAGLAYDLARPDAIGAYQGVDQLIGGLVRAAGPALLSLLILSGTTAGWVATAVLFAIAGLLAPGLTRWAERSRPPAVLAAVNN